MGITAGSRISKPGRLQASYPKWSIDLLGMRSSPETSAFEIKPEELPCPLWQTSPKASIPVRIPNLFKSFITRLCPHRNSIVISILLKTKVMSQNQFAEFYEEARRVKSMMFRFIDYLRTHDET